jgi:hypothetical protein
MSSFLYSLQYTTRYEEVTDSLIYFGEAAPGASESAPIWRIKRLETVAGLTTVLYAGGTNNFNSVWADRTSLIYS